MSIQEMVDARKDRLEQERALSVTEGVNKVIVAKGKKAVEFDMKKDPPPKGELLKHLLGPSGNLRAPAIRSGKTLLVGFNEEAYAKVFR